MVGFRKSYTINQTYTPEADVELDEAIDVAEKNCNMQLDVFGWRRWLCYHVEINGTAYP